MVDSPDSPAPEDAPLHVGDDEVERLLNEAESLTAEIADDAGVETEPTDPDAASSPADPGEPSGEAEDRPDPLTAAAKVENAAKGLGDLLRDSDEAESAAPSAPSNSSSPAKEAPQDESASVPPPNQGGDDSDGFSDLTAEDLADIDSAGGDAGPVPGPDGDEEAPIDILAEGDEETPASDESTNPVQIARLERCLRGLKSAPSWLSQAPKTVPATLQAAIIWTDRPFAGLSPGVKRVLGAIALASILTGIAAWVLPSALANNQFAEMPTNTAVDGALSEPLED